MKKWKHGKDIFNEAMFYMVKFVLYGHKLYYGFVGDEPKAMGDVCSLIRDVYNRVLCLLVDLGDMR